MELANGVEGLLEPLEGLSTAAEQMVDRQTGISRDTMMAPFLEGEGTRDDQQPRRQMARTPRDTDPLTESRSEQLAELKNQVAEIRELLQKQITTGVTRDWYSANQVADRTGYKPWTIRQACNKGRIKASKGDDGRWRVPHEELVRLQERGLPAE